MLETRYEKQIDSLRPGAIQSGQTGQNLTQSAGKKIMLERKHWPLQDAKNKFSSLVERAQHDGPQIVTKHGKETVVVLSVDEYKRLIRPKTDLVQFFQSSPLAGEDIELTRSKELPRDIEL